jgi:hypothetical protein
VQLIQVDYEATIVAPEGVEDKAAEKRLQQELWAQQRRGQLSLDLQAINRQWLDTISNSIDTYFRPGKPLTGKAKLTMTCSGWFATPDGYLVTAAHCVRADRAALLAQLGPKAMAEFIAKDYASSLKNFSGVPLDAGMRANLMTIARKWYTEHATITQLSSTVSVQVSVPGDDRSRDVRATPAEVVSAGEAFPGRDAALLKVSTPTPRSTSPCPSSRSRPATTAPRGFPGC